MLSLDHSILTYSHYSFNLFRYTTYTTYAHIRIMLYVNITNTDSITTINNTLLSDQFFITVYAVRNITAVGKLNGIIL